MECWKIIKVIIFRIFKTLFCLFITGDILYTAFMLDGYGDYTTQMTVYMSILVFLAIANWVILFSKLNRGYKFLIILLTILCYSNTVKYFPDVAHIDYQETCLDVGICHEGTQIRVDDVVITITEENCHRNNFVWNSEKKSCNVREKINK